MKIIVPMAGAGKRLRPHTLTTPKPLLPVAGRPIVQRLVEDIVAISSKSVDEIAFVTGRFGAEAEKNLLDVAARLGARGTIHYQDEPLGTAHAILCASGALQGNVTVAFADTLFRADFAMDTTKDGVLWVQKINDPRQFGVVIVNDGGIITGFEEKPQHFVSDLAMIGIYYFNDGEFLRKELQYLVDNNIRNQNEFQLPDALRNMMKKGAQFLPGTVSDWMDCGNKDALVDTNRKVLQYSVGQKMVSDTVRIESSEIIQPCFIGEDVVLKNSTVGPHVSIGNGCVVENSVIENSIVLNETKIRNAYLANSMLGSFAEFDGRARSVSISDYSTIRN